MEHGTREAASSGGAPRSSNTPTNTAVNASAASPANALAGSLATASSMSLPNPRTRGMSNPHAATAAFPSGAGTPSGGESSRPRRATNRAQMLVYNATEKDCMGDDGEAQECVICFEEFEAGDEMGRLVCLCKFHRVSLFFLNFHVSVVLWFGLC